MGNWFEDHPARSILVYTIFVAGSTWAVSHFLLDTRKIENLETIIESYKAKGEVIERENAALREANKEYLSALRGTPGTIEFFQEKVRTLEAKNRDLTAEARLSQTAAQVKPPQDETTRSARLRKGESFIDPKTGLIFGVTYVGPDYRMTGTLELPGKARENIEKVEAGQAWNFVTKSGKAKLIVREVNWISDSVRIEVQDGR